MNKLLQLVAGPQVCDQLVELGITPRAFFWHVKEVEDGKESWDLWELDGAEYKPGEIVPAWTKQELDVMIGGDAVKPDLMPHSHTPVRTNDDKKTYFDYKYVLAYVHKMKDWERTKFIVNPGARASADLLIMLLGNKATTPALANDRYQHFFKH